MYPAFLCSRKPPAGRAGAYRIHPPTRPGIRGECVFLVFKHRFIVIQAPFKRHSNSALRAVGEGRMRYAPTPVRASCTQLSWLASLTPPASAEAGKLAGYLKSPYQANFAGVRPLPRLGRWPGTSKARTKQTSPASVDAPRARKVSKHAAERFRGLGKLQNTPLNVSEASESSKTRR